MALCSTVLRLNLCSIIFKNDESMIHSGEFSVCRIFFKSGCYTPLSQCTHTYPTRHTCDVPKTVLHINTNHTDGLRRHGAAYNHRKEYLTFARQIAIKIFNFFRLARCRRRPMLRPKVPAPASQPPASWVSAEAIALAWSK